MAAGKPLADYLSASSAFFRPADAGVIQSRGQHSCRVEHVAQIDDDLVAPQGPSQPFGRGAPENRSTL